MAKKSKKIISPNKQNLKTLSARVKGTREHFESQDKKSGLWTQKACAKRADIPYRLWNDIERGKIKYTSYIFKMAAVLNTTAEWLLTGKDESAIKFISNGHEEKISFNQKYPILQHYAPIITWQQAGRTILSSKDVIGDYKRIQLYQKANIYSFVLIMDGDSMVNPDKGMPTFLPGDMLHFDPLPPSKKPKHGDYVIARVSNEKTAIFRQYITDCGKPYLKAFNPQYPLIEVTNEVKIFGQLIFQGRDLRS